MAFHSWPGLFGRASEDTGDLREAVAQRLYQQIVLAPEMLVKAAVGQTRVPHHG
jgi:hypothetical protein